MSCDDYRRENSMVAYGNHESDEPENPGTHQVAIYRVEKGEWKFDHVLSGLECHSLSEASGIANGYNGGSLRDPKWLFMAVGEPVRLGTR